MKGLEEAAMAQLGYGLKREGNHAIRTVDAPTAIHKEAFRIYAWSVTPWANLM
jgi:hypothetical protein